MMALSSCIVTCLALSTAAATCCWCCKHTVYADTCHVIISMTTITVLDRLHKLIYTSFRVLYTVYCRHFYAQHLTFQWRSVLFDRPELTVCLFVAVHLFFCKLSITIDFADRSNDGIDEQWCDEISQFAALICDGIGLQRACTCMCGLHSAGLLLNCDCAL